jgi:hypothetical protein
MVQQRERDEAREQNNSPKTKNMTGLPGSLKAGIETISGLSLDDVHVHYNSSEPARVEALAYTQGTDIHVGPGQEQHLAHEAWHVVQQMQGRVKPTQMTNNIKVNDNEQLESEADTMAKEASVAEKETDANLVSTSRSTAGTNVVQKVDWNYIYKKQGAHGLLEQIRNTYNVGTKNEYDIVDLKTWQQQAEKWTYFEPAKKAPTQQGGTVGGLYTSVRSKPIVFVNEKLVIKPALAENAIGNIVSTLRHEYEHVQQRNSPDYEYKYKTDIATRGALAEFEAYWTEVVSALREQDPKEAPSDEYFIDAVKRAKKEYNGLSYDAQKMYAREYSFLETIVSLPKSRQERQNLLIQIQQKVQASKILTDAVADGVFNLQVIGGKSTLSLATTLVELDKFHRMEQQRISTQNLAPAPTQNLAPAPTKDLIEFF